MPEESAEKVSTTCFICAEKINIFAYGSCFHFTCHLCILRMWALYDRKACPYCKNELNQLNFTKSIPNSSNPINFKHHNPDKTLFFETASIKKTCMELQTLGCAFRRCGEGSFHTWEELKTHTLTKHRMSLCNICVEHKKIFSCEHRLYSHLDLQKHMRQGLPTEDPFKGHPQCGFCKINFYGDDELYEHCRKDHETCHLCVRRGKRYQYFQNYDSLEEHFSGDHFMCPYPICLEKKFVVFDSEIDYKAHLGEEHSFSLNKNQKKMARQIDLGFSYAGSYSQASQSSTLLSNQQRPSQSKGKKSRGANINEWMKEAANDMPTVSSHRFRPSATQQQGTNGTTRTSNESNKKSSSSSHIKKNLPATFGSSLTQQSDVLTPPPDENSPESSLPPKFLVEPSEIEAISKDLSEFTPALARFFSGSTATFPDRLKVFRHLMVLFIKERIPCQLFYMLLTQLFSSTHLPVLNMNSFYFFLNYIAEYNDADAILAVKERPEMAKVYPSALNKHLSQVVQLISDEHQEREFLKTHHDYRVITDQNNNSTTDLFIGQHIAPILSKNKDKGKQGGAPSLSMSDFPAALPSQGNGISGMLRGSWQQTNASIQLGAPSISRASHSPSPPLRPSSPAAKANKTQVVHPSWGPSLGASSSSSKQDFPELPKSTLPKQRIHPESLAFRAQSHRGWVTASASSSQGEDQYEVTSTHRRVKKQNDKKKNKVLLHFG